MSIRLLRVVLRDEDDAKTILYNAKKLRDMPQHSKIFINPDLTPYQQKLNKTLRDELKRTRASGEDVIIRGGKVVPRNEPQTFR